MERERSTIQDPIHVDDYEILQKAMENLTAFENEYLELMEEQDALQAKDMPWRRNAHGVFFICGAEVDWDPQDYTISWK